MKKYRIYHSERFRTPSQLEIELGLWIDRVGNAVARFESRPRALRLLGLFGAVAILDGEGVLISECTGELKVRRGDVILLFPEVPAMYYPFDCWTSNWVVWQGREAENLFRLGYFREENPIISGAADFVSQTRCRILSLFDRESPDAVLERKVILLEMLLFLAKISQNKDGVDPQRDMIDRVRGYFSSNIGSSSSIAELARQNQLSESQFRRLFKRHAGVSPKIYLMNLRINRAKELLARGKSIKECALETGFHDEFHFMRTFKEKTGSSAGEFRNTI